MIGRRRAALLLLAIPAVTGCEWWLRITEVSGTVTRGGKPVRGVQVVFEPAARNRPRALASTDAAGRYRLTRLGPGNKSGAAAGRYTVKIIRDDEDRTAPSIPPEYGTASTLTFEVVAGRPNVFDIDIPTP